MQPTDLLVRCMARREGDVWVAVCVDFTLAAQADTFDLARKALHEQIATYVREAFTVDKEHAIELLTRKGPLSDRIKFRVLKALRVCLEHTRRAVRHAAYIEPLPVALSPAA